MDQWEKYNEIKLLSYLLKDKICVRQSVVVVVNCKILINDVTVCIESDSLSL